MTSRTMGDVVYKNNVKYKGAPALSEIIYVCQKKKKKNSHLDTHINAISLGVINRVCYRV